jgi:formylglycine-generating enzyme required for sulfatase activity
MALELLVRGLLRMDRHGRGGRLAMACGIALLAVAGLAGPAPAVTIDWVGVQDPGNVGETQTYSGTAMTFGAVGSSFRIMKYEWTNAQYAEFLNAVDPQGINPNAIYNAGMGTDARGGIAFNAGNSAGTKYSTRTNMGDKPVNLVSWFDAARVSNWLHNGAQIYGVSDASATAPQNIGAYTLGTGTNGTAPAKNAGAKFYVPTENEWYKAAYYKGAGTNAGYWNYATGSDTIPTAVGATLVGSGSAGPAGNFANYNQVADWNGQDGNVTTVGTNGGPGAYGTFDQTGNIAEWNDLTGAAGPVRGIRGGLWLSIASNISSLDRFESSASFEQVAHGFRLAGTFQAPVPEIDPGSAASVIALLLGTLAWSERRCRLRA